METKIVLLLTRCVINFIDRYQNHLGAFTNSSLLLPRDGVLSGGWKCSVYTFPLGDYQHSQYYLN